jgi:hypothetical protein
MLIPNYLRNLLKKRAKRNGKIPKNCPTILFLGPPPSPKDKAPGFIISFIRAAIKSGCPVTFLKWWLSLRPSSPVVETLDDVMTYQELNEMQKKDLEERLLDEDKEEEEEPWPPPPPSLN